jgi:hypothetical protein
MINTPQRSAVTLKAVQLWLAATPAKASRFEQAREISIGTWTEVLI